MKCRHGKISSPLTEIPVGKTEISVTEPARPLIWTHQSFTKDLEVRRDLGNRASPVNRAHLKRPLVIHHAFLPHERLLKRATHSFPFVKKLSTGNHVRVTFEPISAVSISPGSVNTSTSSEEDEAFSKYSSETLILFPRWVMHLHSRESKCECLVRVWCHFIY